MDVFALDDHLLAQYTGFARSFTRIRSAELGAKSFPAPSRRSVSCRPHNGSASSSRRRSESPKLR